MPKARKVLLRKRIQMMSVLLSILSCFMVIALISLPTSSVRLGEQINTASVRAETVARQTQRGDLLDRNGESLTQNSLDGRSLLFPALSPVIGYSSKIYKFSGLEFFLNDKLTSSASHTKIGDSFRLSLSLPLSQRINDIAKRNDALSSNGTIIIMDANTGEILTMLSYPIFDANMIDEQFNELVSTGVDYFNNKALQAFVPGSVWKIITSAAIIRAGNHIAVYNDSGEYSVDGITIKNAGGAKYGELTEGVITGLGKSVNTYMAYKANEMQPDVYESVIKDFLIGEKLEFDFGVTQSAYSLGTNGFSRKEIALTSFGQGKTLISPIQITMVTATVANGGYLVEPHMVLGKTASNGKAYHSKPTKNHEKILSKKECAYIESGMQLCSEVLKFDPALCIYTKTGTAQTGRPEEVHKWLTAYVTINGKSYAITVAAFYCEGFGKDLKPVIDDIVNILYEFR